MERLELSAERTARATPEAVWALVSDATRYPDWGPWRAAKYRRPGDTSPRGPGAVQWLQSSRRYLMRYPVSVEKILEVEEGRRLAYTVIRGIPVRNYRAEVTLTPTGDGTHIRWAATFDSTPRGRLVWRGLRTLYPEIVEALAGAAERQDPQPARQAETQTETQTTPETPPQTAPR
ncbi:MAG: SRPBCC family protein [Acidimicrobiaceae bacterium]|nr:SRPBCC family protein [Acidimicrobiaceae bacterium]